MDRTSWIIVGVCAALLGLNIYLGNNKKETPVTAPPVAVQQPVSAVNTAAPGTSTASEPATPGQLSVNQALKEDKNNPITLAATEEVDGQQKPFITYTFNRIGGSIGGVTLHNDIVDTQKVTDHNITINEAQNRGIGELVFNMDATQDPSYDNTVYKEVKRTADSVTLEGYDAARQLFISKTYTLHPVTDSSGKVLPGSKYIIRLTVSLLNKASQCPGFALSGHLCRSAYPIAKSEPKDTYTHLFYHADGSWNRRPLPLHGRLFQHCQAPRAGRPTEGPDLRRGDEPVLRHHPHSAGTIRGSTCTPRREFPLAHETMPWCPV
ncbi:MAG: hypothetical protein ACLSUW_06105 [Akkermansia sp.]